MASLQRYHGSSFFLTFAIAIAGLATGCCGPCGPMTRGGIGCDSRGMQASGATCGDCSGGCDSCSNGCGETYIDEWINHPPTCDPCDSCGNHNGQTCNGCRPMFQGFRSIWGYRCDRGPAGCQRCEESCDVGCGCGDSSCDGGCSDGGCSDGGCSSGGCTSCGGGNGGCSSCGGGEHLSHQSMGHQMEHYADSLTAMPMPHRPSRAPHIVQAKPSIKPYQPQRTKQIFRPRATVATSSARMQN